MSNTERADIEPDRVRRGLLAGLLPVGAFATALAAQTPARATHHADADTGKADQRPMTSQSPLTDSQLAIGPIAAAAAAGDMPALSTALNSGLDAGLTISDIKEVLVQLYAYAGFPRSLNALGNFMKVVEERRGAGKNDATGRDPGPLPAPDRMLEIGTANQTKLSGAPVRGPLFDFAPAADQYLKTHLFGDIFARDNLDWRNRELATVAMLSALAGVEPQLLAHVRISLNTGLTIDQLKQFGATLADKGEKAYAQRLTVAIDSHLAAAKA